MLDSFMHLGYNFSDGEEQKGEFRRMEKNENGKRDNGESLNRIERKCLFLSFFVFHVWAPFFTVFIFVLLTKNDVYYYD